MYISTECEQIVQNDKFISVIFIYYFNLYISFSIFLLFLIKNAGKNIKIKNWRRNLKARTCDLTPYYHKTLSKFNFTGLFKFIVQKLLLFWSASKSKCQYYLML